MKLRPNLLQKRRDEEGRRAPRHLLGGRIRTSTVVLLVAFVALWWTYETYRPHPEPATAPPSQVVPPGYVPDPAYTWVPRTRVGPPKSTPSPTPTPTTTVTPPSPTITTTTPGIQLPCIPPFCPPTTTPATPSAPSQGPGPTPSSVPPAR